MPRSLNQKMKLFYLLKILRKKTDSTHSLTLSEIQSELEGYGIEVERKTLYGDFDSLRQYGIDIEMTNDGIAAYYMASREFQLPELKLLVDAVQSSKFITKKKSAELIEKLSGMASEHERLLLNRQVYVANRVKTFNEKVYYNVDAVYEAIGNDSKISFQYYEWTVRKEKRFRHDGMLYIISPWAMTWDDDNYYMIGYDSEAGIIKHFRVDKMANISQLGEARDGDSQFKNFDMGMYSKQVFGMFGGRPELVTLECDETLAGVIIDTFGTDTTFFGNEDRFKININVAVSPTFLSWVFGFGDKMKIIAPETVIAEFKNLSAKALEQY